MAALLRAVVLTAFASLAISSSGCLFSGRPCESGNWHYRSCQGGCSKTGPGTCRTCASPPDSNDLNETIINGRDRPKTQPTAEKIPPLPATGAMRPPRPSATRIPQVARLEWDEPVAPGAPAKKVSMPISASNGVPRGAQSCAWQQPGDTPPRSIPRESPSQSARPKPKTAQTSHSLPAASGTSPGKSAAAPFAWGYFGVAGRQ